VNKEETLQKVKKVGLLAVLRGPTPILTIFMVDALIAGGVVGIEVTYSTPNALEVVSNLHRKYGDAILLGMGTLTQPHQAKDAKEAGASFIVSPICQPDLVKAMTQSGLLVMAGALTPTEVFQAHQLGADVVKVFPGSLAGPSYLKALRGPFPNIPLMPTGGVSKENITDWFAAGAIAVGAGSELCPFGLAKEERYDEITAIARGFKDAVDAARGQ
jgi:2-dehydro-3-deoxyphosphogluconate aldolase/(4S)-4-hydroxy-2-oxoglutarate aldolase